ncbi:hypothetical protein V6Z77_010212 [Aspergillus fumigatus]
MPPAGAGIRRGRRPCACRCKCPRRRRAALRCRQGARAPANWSPLAPPVSVWVSLDPVSVPGARRPTGHPRCLRVCRSASVCPWRAPLPAGGRPAQGAPANWSPCRPPARRPRRANSASQLAAARSRLRASPLSLALLALLASSSSPSRLLLAASPARALLPPQPRYPHPSPGPSAAPRRLLLHIPTDLARPIIVRANVPGVRTSFPGETHLRPADRAAARAAKYPSQLVTALRHRAAAARRSPQPSRPANWRESMEVEIPGDRPSPVPPRLRRKVSGPPRARRPGLMGGVCQQI